MSTKKDKVIKIWSLICGGIAFFCFGIYLLSELSRAAEVLYLTLGFSAVAVIAVPPLCAILCRKAKQTKFTRIVRMCYLVGGTFFVVTFAVLWCIVGYSTLGDTTETVEENAVILVYGCRVNGEEPGEMLAERLTKALSLMESEPTSVCIVSGGVDYGEVLSEGEVMGLWLERHGIDPSRIIVDSTAETTKGNIRAYLAVLQENGWEDRPCISVSSDFHMPRIMYLCPRYGLSCTYAGAETKRFNVLMHAMVREYLAYAKLLTVGVENE